jgi:hypothetical protein
MRADSSAGMAQGGVCACMHAYEAAHMILSARASHASDVTGAPQSSTAPRAASAARLSGAQMRTTPSASALATFCPPDQATAPCQIRLILPRSSARL